LKEGFTVRPATVVDVEAVTAMWLKMAEMHAAYDPQRWHWCEAPAEKWAKFFVDSLARDSAVILVAADRADRPVGFLVGAIAAASPVMAVRTRAEVSDLYIEPGLRRSGLGTALLNEAFDRFGRRGAEQVVLSVAVANTEAIRLYEKLGLTTCIQQMYKAL